MVLIGACGWQHTLWNDTYYPEGLPEDWQLAFYSNEYPVVLIPASYWSQGRSAVDSWLQETVDRPDFICEWTLDVGDEQFQLISILGNRVLGILVKLNAMPDEAQWQSISNLTQSHSVVIDWPEATVQQVQALLSLETIQKSISICWHGDEARSDELNYGELALARVPTLGQSPRSLRGLLETLIKRAGERQAILMFDGEPPDLEVVDQAEVLLDLI